MFNDIPNNHNKRVGLMRTITVFYGALIFSLSSFGVLAQDDIPQKSIEDLFKHAMLAEAAYVDFIDVTDEASFKSKLEDSTQFGNEEKRKILLQNYEFLHHMPDQYWTGFSATVFKDANPPDPNSPRVTFASRGTAGGLDIIDADISGIVQTGVATNQVIDLYNYVQKLKAPVGQYYDYVRSTPLNNLFITHGQANDGLGHGDWFQTENVNGSGHSLGGNLTAAFGRLFPTLAKDSYTINSAGTAGILATFFGAVNPLRLDEDRFYKQMGGADSYFGNYATNSDVYGTDGIEMTTSDVTFSQQGGANRIPLNIEYAGPISTHFGQYMVESLGTAWSFNKVDPSYDLSTHSILMDASHRTELEQLKTMTSGLLKMLLPSAPIVDRWASIKSIVDSGQTGTIKVLANLSPSELVDYAKQGDDQKKSVIYAALEGLPFAYVKSYANVDSDSYSDEALLDISKMLAIELYTNATGFTVLNSVGKIIFTKPNGSIIDNVILGDAETNVIFGTDQPETKNGSGASDHLYGFSGDDTLEGLAGNDHLEGGDGTDTLRGGDGNDILIGGKGDDTLEGNKGFDVLHGGDGNDTYLVTSDSGHTLIYDEKEKKSDDTGSLKYDGQVIDGSGALRRTDSANSYFNKEKEILYMLIDEQLTIQFESNGSVKAVVNIPNFSNGNLGINLPEELDEFEDQTTLNYLVSSVSVTEDDGNSNTCLNLIETALSVLYDNTEILYGEAGNCYRSKIEGNQTVTNDTGKGGVIFGGDGDDRIIGNAEEEFIHGNGGEDYIEGGAGNDFIGGERTILGFGMSISQEGGIEGSDWIDGGDGHDTILGGAMYQSGYLPESDFPREYEYGLQDFQDANNHYEPEKQNDILIGNLGSDVIYGNAGDDMIFGGKGDDTLFGGAHSDRIEGGDGNDIIHGDMEILLYLEYDGEDQEFKTYHDEVKDAAGDDVIAGGAGDDAIHSGAGDDTISGGDGDDYITGDGSFREEDEKVQAEMDLSLNGKDYILAGAGKDTVWGFGNGDVIHGNEGDDILWGDHKDLDDAVHGDDIIYGGDGDDEIGGHAGNDLLYGDAGKDLIDAGKGNDELHGGKGEDELQGKEGNDQLFGEEDDDVLFGDEGSDSLYGGKGQDELIGGDGDDSLYGGRGIDYLYGGEGNDTLSGGVGDDNIQGDEGNDTLSGGSGVDALRGGAGNDTYIAKVGFGESNIEDNQGTNSVNFGGGVSISTISVVVNDVGVFIDYGYADTVFIESGSMGAAWSINFANEASVSLSLLMQEYEPPITATTQVEVAQGVRAEDLTYGRSENSLLINYLPIVPLDPKPQASAARAMTQDQQQEPEGNWIDPSALAEAGIVFSLKKIVIDGEEYQQLSLTNWFNADSANYLNSLKLGDEIIDLTQISGLGSTFDGSDNADTITTSDENDIIQAKGGADTVNAKSGDDQIIGGKGNDKLFGGQGDDHYHFSVGDGIDSVFDESGNDTVFLGPSVSSSNLNVTELKDGLLIKIETLSSDNEPMVDAIFISSWFQNVEAKIENVVFSNGSTLSASALEQMITGNRSPVATAELAEQTTSTNELFNFVVPSALFVDPNVADTLETLVLMSDGAQLPSWLTYDPITLTLSGTPLQADIGSLSLIIIAADPQGFYALAPLTLNVVIGDGIEGTSENDALNGGSDNDTLNGLEGDDVIDAGEGDDTLNGGAGDDVLQGGRGDDVFIFNPGDGVDTILTPYNDYSQFSDNDVIVFGYGILSSEVTLFRDPVAANNLLVNYGLETDQITIENFFTPIEIRYPVDQIKFENGEVFDAEQIREMIQHVIDENDNKIYVVKDQDTVFSLAGDDYLSGGLGADELHAGDGDDTLYGRAGDDLLVGGKGNDSLTGGGGDNTIVFASGHGVDKVALSESEATETLSFATDIPAGQLKYYKFGDDLVISTKDVLLDLPANVMPSVANDFIIARQYFGYYPITEEINDRLSIELSDETTIDLSAVTISGAYLDLKNDDYISDNLSSWSAEYGSIYELEYPDPNYNFDFDYNLSGTIDDDIILGSAINDHIASRAGNDLIYAGNGDDMISLYSFSGTNYVYGEEGNDHITGGEGFDHISGGTGDDILVLEKDANIYFELGDGEDLVQGNNYSTDNLNFIFPDNLTANSFIFSIENDGRDLVLSWGNLGDSLRFEEWLTVSEDTLEIDKAIVIRFGETVWTLSDIKNRLVKNVNFAPVANSDNGFTTEKDITLLIAFDELLKNDTDLNNDELTVVSVYDAQAGTVSLDQDNREVSFTPETGYSGLASFSYSVSDGELESEASVAVNILSGQGEDNPNDGVPPNPDDYDYVIDGTDSDEQIYNSNLNDYLSGLGGNDQLFGLGGNDYLFGGEGDDYLDGGTGDDIQDGGEGNDQLGGDAGNDLLIGGSGDDLYVFRAGSGQDTIDNSIGEDGVDWLIFTDDITDDRLVFTRVENDLVITILNSDDKVTILNWFLGSGYRVDYIQPSGANGISADAIEAQLSDPVYEEEEQPILEGWSEPQAQNYDNQIAGTENAEQLYIGYGSDFIEGLGGDDQLFGVGGNDYLSGGLGNDYLDGGEGDDIQFGGDGNDQLGGDNGNDLLIGGSGTDIYVYRPNGGSDIIDNSVGENGNDWLLFTDDLTSDRLNFVRVGDDLLITVDDSEDQVLIKKWYLGTEYQVDYIQPSGEAGIPAAQIGE